MCKRGNLREFQAHLATRLAEASGQNAAGLLGIRAGSEFWLLNLSYSGEIIPLTPLTSVLSDTKMVCRHCKHPWKFACRCFADFSAFQNKEPTPQNASFRLLLIGTRHGNNAALLVTRALGLGNFEAMTPAAPDLDAPPWPLEAYTDADGRRWKMLNVKELLLDEQFMKIGV